jgi:hypothetical protein
MKAFFTQIRRGGTITTTSRSSVLQCDHETSNAQHLETPFRHIDARSLMKWLLGCSLSPYIHALSLFLCSSSLLSSICPQFPILLPLLHWPLLLHLAKSPFYFHPHRVPGPQ